MTISQGVWVAAIYAMLFVAPLVAQEAGESGVLKVKPDRCIALRQGQFCYQKVVFQWSTSAAHTYCLYAYEVDSPMVCWSGSKLSVFEYDFKSMQDQSFYLKDEDTEEILGEVNVDVAWVYKSGKKVSTGWRLF